MGRGKIVTIGDETNIDLDSSRPDWGVTTVSSRTGLDLRVYLPIAQLGTPYEVKVARATEQADLAYCNATTLRFSGIEKPDFMPGKSFCVLTDEKKWVWLKIVAVEPDAVPSSITLAIEKLGDFS